MPSDGLPKNLEPLAAGDPATIGSYVLAGRLGSGGMGTVYLGRTPDQGALVAIKVIRPELAFDEATRARFRDEMENAQRVASFCTAKILDHGTFEDRPYMVTEYISGTALAEHVAEHGPLDSSTLHGFALGIAAALAAIHGAGLVHRDLKPANVLLSLSGPRVIDFGIARALNTATNHTQTGIVMGSPGWMAPEQLLEENVTTAADIFAWGCLVAFAGNGSHPFGNGDAMTLGKRVLFAEPQLADLTAPLDRLVAAALTKDASRRPKAQDLMLELAGGGPEGNDPNDMVSHALHQSWRPNLPPLPPMPPGAPPATGQPPAGASRPPGQAAVPAPQGGVPSQPPYAPPHGRQAPPAPQPPNGPAPQGRPPQAQQPTPHTGQFPANAPHQTGSLPPVPPHSQTGPHPQRAQPYVPPAPPPPHAPAPPERNRLRWIVAAAIGGTVLLILLVTATWTVINGAPRMPWQEPSTSPETEQESQEQAPQRPSSPEGAVDMASDEWLEFTVFEPECGLSAHGPMHSEGGSYCAVPVRAHNISEEMVEIAPRWQEMRDQHSRWVTAEHPTRDEAEEPLWQPIAPGSEARGTIVFLLSDDAKPDRLRLRGDERSGGATVDLPDVSAEPA